MLHFTALAISRSCADVLAGSQIRPDTGAKGWQATATTSRTLLRSAVHGLRPLAIRWAWLGKAAARLGHLERRAVEERILEEALLQIRLA